MPGFDRLALVYRWIEYLAFGSALERCRETYLERAAGLDRIAGVRRVLVLGDGDGRFTARLLSSNPGVRVVAIDSSAAMLRELQMRVRRVGAAHRLTAVEADAVTMVEAAPGTGISCPGPRPSCQGDEAGFNAVVTHFFLDCLSTDEVRRLAAGVGVRLAPGGEWIVSEFAAPTAWTRWIVKGLYLCFGLMTGLRVRSLPEWERMLREAGFARRTERGRLRGLLTASVWERAA